MVIQLLACFFLSFIIIFVVVVLSESDRGMKKNNERKNSLKKIDLFALLDQIFEVAYSKKFERLTIQNFFSKLATF